MKTDMKVTCAIFALALMQTATASCKFEIYSKTAPDLRFAVKNDGTVKDVTTGLMWTKCAVGELNEDTKTCTKTPTAYTWKQALDAVKTLNNQKYLGHSDWRLPNIKELASLAEFECRSDDNAYINDDIFTGKTDQPWWSSTPVQSRELYANRAYGFDFTPQYDHYFSMILKESATGKIKPYVHLVRDVK